MSDEREDVEPEDLENDTQTFWSLLILQDEYGKIKN